MALLQVTGFDWTDASVAEGVNLACLRHHVYEWELIRRLLAHRACRAGEWLE